MYDSNNMTHDDLKQFGKLLDEKLEEKLNQKLAPIQKDLTGVQTDLAGVKTDLAGVKTDLTGVQKTLKQHGKILHSLNKTQDVMLKVLDGEQVKQDKRLTRVEKHIGLPSAA